MYIEKVKHKILILAIKFIPTLVASFYFVTTLLHYYGIEPLFMQYLVSQSLISIILLYLLSAVFKFCLYHRIFIHYISTNFILSYFDNSYGIPISDKQYLYLQMCLLFMALLIALFSYIKKNNIKILK